VPCRRREDGRAAVGDPAIISQPLYMEILYRCAVFFLLAPLSPVGEAHPV
jgi:hypothetical protein